ncbi:MAG TPA: cytochrome c-type biogenesis protein CcmH, partial [Azonexus sp.]
MIARALILALCLVSTGVHASAAKEAALAADPVAEKRLQALSKELRCLVCQNE